MVPHRPMAAAGVVSLNLAGSELPVTKRKAPVDMETATAEALLLGSNTNLSSFTCEDGPTDRLVWSRKVSLARASASVLTSSLAKTALPSNRVWDRPPTIPDTLFCTRAAAPMDGDWARAGMAPAAKIALASVAPRTWCLTCDLPYNSSSPCNCFDLPDSVIGFRPRSF